MKCKFCGWEVPEGEKVCPACGASVESDHTESKETDQTQQGYGQHGIQGQDQQGQSQYGISGQGLQSQDQQGQSQYGISGQGLQGQDQQGQFQYGTSGPDQQDPYQYGAPDSGRQSQFQYGASGPDQQGQNQYGPSGQEFQNQYQNGSWDQTFQNQYGASGQGFQGQYQNGPYGQNQQGQYQQGQYQYGSPDQASYSYGRTEGGDYGQPVKQISGTPYMIFAIITTLLCCLPLGIAGIVFACKINPLQKAGDYAGAQEEAKKAKIAIIVGMVVGGIISVIYIIIFFAGMKEYTSPTPYPSIEYRSESETNEEPLESAEPEKDDDFGTEDVDDTDDTDETKPAVQQAEPSSELGATWNTFTVQVNDKVLTLPCTMGELEATGLTLDTEDTPENYVVNAREYVYTYFKDANGNEVLIDIVNLTQEPKSLGECIIGGISVYDYDLENGGLAVVFPGGIQIGTPKEDVIAKYGETEDAYEDDEDYHMYTWYADNAYYSYCEIDVDAETGLVCSMFMENYGE